MAATSSNDTEVSIVKEKLEECICTCTCSHVKVPSEWAIMTQEETEAVKESMEQLSLFCARCLSPYSGEISSDGYITLSCTRCRYVEVVKQDMVKDASDIELFTGDIISNKFNRILNFENEFKKIDIHDPYNVDDDFKRLHEMHASILKAIGETTFGMRVVIDGHRMAHNMNVYRERQLLQDQLDNNTQTRKRNKREREKACLVEISGSAAKNNFILDPKTFSMPTKVISKLKLKGHEGVLNMDRKLLALGLPKVFIKESMPLYHSRLKRYEDNIRCAFVPGRGGAECEICNCGINNVDVLYKISDDDIMCEEDESELVSSKENHTECAASSQLNSTVTNKDGNVVLKSSSDNHEMQPKKRKKHRQSSQVHHAQDDFLSMLECLATPKTDYTEMEKVMASIAETNQSAITQYTGPTDPDIDFRRYLGITDYADDYEEQKFILGHLDKIQTDDVEKYNFKYVKKVCAEVMDGIRQRKDAAMEERRERIIDYLQSTKIKMCTKVDDVRDDIINQLKMAYQRRMIRNKKLKEIQGQLLEYAMMEENVEKDVVVKAIENAKTHLLPLPPKETYDKIVVKEKEVDKETTMD